MSEKHCLKCSKKLTGKQERFCSDGCRMSFWHNYRRGLMSRQCTINKNLQIVQIDALLGVSIKDKRNNLTTIHKWDDLK